MKQINYSIVDQPRKKIQINPSWLTIARMSRGKSIKELSAEIHQSPVLLNRFEHGQKVPENILLDISKVLDYPVEFFTRFGRNDYICNVIGEKKIRKFFSCMNPIHFNNYKPEKELTEKQKQYREKLMNQLREQGIID